MSELDAYDYFLPSELIAQDPLPHRADSRLLVVERDTLRLSHRHIRDLPDLLRPNDCLVLNDTRVVPARLLGHRTLTGGRWEGLFLSVDGRGDWQIMGKCRGKLRPNEPITLHDAAGRDDVKLWLLEKLPDGAWIAHPEGTEDTWTLLDRLGHVPLPAYIRGGKAVLTDRARYQTVYARTPGSAAAPTAGLHFTDRLLSKLIDRGVFVCRVTLHVGPGTFRPVSAERLADHVMHSEWGEITSCVVERIETCRRAGGRIIAVGTTSMRVLETAAAEGTLQPWSGETSIFIRPPYKFQACDGLLTNFHLPRSTLLVLVRTFGGDQLMQAAYDEAIGQRYRFYSFGDAMLIT
ncbi:MAG: tRNA preQ1(34) S-adenosylmethionine ribosyltransferase-isomerase QueA [Pirellulales bacterium]